MSGHQRSGRDFGPKEWGPRTQFGQLNSSLVPQQTGWSNKEDIQNGPKTVDSLPSEEEPGDQGEACSGEILDWDGGSAEQSGQQGIRMDDSPEDFSDGIEVVEPPIGGWVCQQIQLPDEEVLVIPGGPGLPGSGLLSGELGPGESLDLPAIVLDWEDLEEGLAGRSRSDSRDPSVDRGNMVANNQMVVYNASSESREESPRPGEEGTSSKMGLSRLELIRKATLERGFPEELTKAVIDRYSRGGAEVDARWAAYCLWAKNKGIDPIISSEINLGGFLIHKKEKVLEKRANCYKNTIREVWSFISGSVFENEKLINEVVRTFGKGEPRYEETYDLKGVLTYMDKLFKSTNSIDIRDHLILVIKSQTLIRSEHLSRVKCRDVNICEGFFQYKGQKRDRNGEFTWSKKCWVFQNKEFKSRCFFAALDKYVERFEIDMLENTPLLRDVVRKEKGLVGQTIANRTSLHLMKSGTRVEYKSHSFRMAVACHLLDMGLTIEVVMKIGDWRSLEVFLRFYHRARPSNDIVLALNRTEPVSQIRGDAGKMVKTITGGKKKK